MGSENLVTSDAGLARSQAYDRLARLLPRLPPQLKFSAPFKMILNLSHYARDIVRMFDIVYVLGIFFRTPRYPSLLEYVEFPYCSSF
jgi:hypothetical protein